jgi:hypothetical protein
MPYKDPDKAKEWYKQNKDRINKMRKDNYKILNPPKDRVVKERFLPHSEYMRRYNEIIRGKPTFLTTQEKEKRARLSSWISRGIRFSDSDKVYEEYITSTNCNICNRHYTKGNSSHKKVLEHDHESGYVRFICCQRCNLSITKVDNNRFRVLRELNRYFRLYISL